MTTRKDILQKASSCDTLVAGTYTGKHYRDEDQHFNFATPNSFLNHFNEDNDAYTCVDFHMGYVAKNNWVTIVATLMCHRTNDEITIVASGETIVSAMVQLLIKMF
jgi:hypothetical protein